MLMFAETETQRMPPEDKSCPRFINTKESNKALSGEPISGMNIIQPPVEYIFSHEGRTSQHSILTLE